MKRSVIFILLLLTPLVMAHETGASFADVRVVSANPATKAYSFVCRMDPENTYVRDWFIRPDSGMFDVNLPNEAEFLDLPAGQVMAYTFPSNQFYHVGCIVVNESNFSQLWRGDMHIDLRTSGWDPEIIPISGNGLTATLDCDYSQPHTTTWQVIDATTGDFFDLPYTTDVITHTVSHAGLWDFVCHAHQTSNGQDHQVGLPIEFFSSGTPYFPDELGVADGSSPPNPVCGNGVLEAGEQCDDNNNQNGDGCSATCTTENQQCYNNIQNIPATCNAGTITTDTYNGCRTLICAGKQILACPKTDNTFEMYNQGGPASVQICIAGLCMTNQGFIKSSQFPICTGNTPAPVCGNGIQEAGEQCDAGGSNGVCPAACSSSCASNTCQAQPVCGNGIKEGTEQCDDGNNQNNDGCSATCTTEQQGQTCYAQVNNMPLTCSATVSSDVKSGCRTITCGGKQIQACNKPDNTFEMYNQGGPASVQICIAGLCMTNQGFIKSQQLPICTGGPPPGGPVCGNGVVENGEACDFGPSNGACPASCSLSCTVNVCGPVCGNGVLEAGEQCDDNNNQNGDGCSATCTTENQQCYNNIQNIPATCNAGTITTDTYNGCRTLICAGKQILACPKTDNTFEMYNQGGPASVQICIAGLCMTNQGFIKSSQFPICTGNTPPSGGLQAPVWLDHTSPTGVNPAFFHLEVQQLGGIASTDWEVWNTVMTERVWSEPTATGVDDHHTHTPEGAFEGSLNDAGQLLYSTAYNARARFRAPNGTLGPWSTWLSFTTSAEPILNPNAPAWTAVSGFHVEKFATGFDLPVHVALAPSGMYDHVPANQRPFLYVTELYGKVKVVYQDGSQSVYAQDLLNFEPFGSITGGGQMGVIGLYVDDITGDLFVSTVYVENNEVKNKVLRFVSTNDGRSFTSVQTLIDNLPSTPSHQVQQITKGPDGRIYVNLGEGPDQSFAQNDAILAGKIISMNPDGSNVQTYAKGFRNPFGADWRPGFNQLLVTDNSPNTNDRLLYVQQGGNYGWPAPSSLLPRIDTLNVSPVDVEFNPGGSGFPSGLTGRLYVAVGGPIYTQGPTNGKQILEYVLNPDGSVASRRDFVWYTGGGFGTPIGLDFGPDGLYFTDIYGDPGFVGLGETEGNVYRVVQGDPPAGNGTAGPFRAGVAVHLWYPKLFGPEVEYIFDCTAIDGSGSYLYDFNYGLGFIDPNRQIPTSAIIRYPYQNQEYTVSCTAHDLNTGQQASASMVINPGNFIPE